MSQFLLHTVTTNAARRRWEVRAEVFPKGSEEHDEFLLRCEAMWDMK